MAGANDPANDLFIHEQIQSRYEFEHETSSLLDTKASTLVGWAGLIISLILGGGGILFSSSDVKLASNELYILIGSIASLVGSLVIGLIAFRLIEYEALPDPIVFIQHYGKEDLQKTLRETTVEMAKATKFNTCQNEKKANCVAFALALFTVGMMAAAVFTIMQVAKMVIVP